MKKQHKIDYELIDNSTFLDWNKFKNATVMVTGATGLVGFHLVCSLLYANAKRELNLKVLALVRDYHRALDRFQEWQGDPSLSFVIGTVEDLPIIVDSIDYIVHGASPTSGKTFTQKPVETIKSAVFGTQNILELAIKKKVKGMVYLSSMEIYGTPKKNVKLSEKMVGTFIPQNLRNTYPIGKLECENMCQAYSAEFDVPVRIARLTQVIGTGTNYDDKRLFAYFAQCVKNKKDIVLKTDGATEHSYVYSADAVTAILKLLMSGESGEAYNVADEASYCSISSMAEKIANRYGITVVYDIQDNVKNGYPDTLYVDLDTTKIRNLGWACQVKDIIGSFLDGVLLDNSTDGEI